MVRTSKGIRKRTRNILSRKPRNRGLSPLTRSLQLFDIGEKANIVLDPSVHGGLPHFRFHGKTGTVIALQGRAYLIKLKMGNKTKSIIVFPEHLKKVVE